METFARSPQQIGLLLRNIREGRNLNQAQFAARLGLRQATVSQIEAGATDLKISTLFKILAALDLELCIAPRSKASADDIEDIF